MSFFDDLQGDPLGSALLRTILDTVPAAISFRDTESRFVFINRLAVDTYLSMNPGENGKLDYEPDDFSGKTLDELFGPAAINTVEEMIAEVVVSGETVRNRDMVGPKSHNNYVLNIIPLRDDDGHVLGAVTVATDISERRVMEQALRDSEAFNQAAMSSMIDGLVVIDEGGAIQAFNPAAETLFGYSSGEAIGQNVSMLMTEPDISEHKGYISNYLRTGVSKILHKGPREVTGRHKNGQTLSLELNIGRIDNADSILFVGSLRDISERKRTEAALRKSREEADQAQRRLMDAIENIPEGFALYDADLRLVLHNKTLKDMFPFLADLYDQGASFAEIVSYVARRGAVTEAIGREDEWIAERLRTFGTNDEPIEQNIVGDRWLLLSDHRTSDGGVVSIRTDITDLKQRENELRQAQKMEALGQLTGGIAHDFNNLLAVMMGNIALLQEELDPDSDLKNLTEPALRAIEQASDLTNRMLSFARQQPLKVQSIEPNSFLTNVQPLLRQALSDGIKVEFSTLVGAWPCKADLAQLEQAVLNLAINARDAMPDGGRMRIETANVVLPDPAIPEQPDLPPGEYVSIAIADSGHGIPEADLPRIFDPFYTTKEVGEGSGLGLSMVHGFVKQSHGDIAVRSEIGAGTTFRIYLPRADSAPGISAPVKPAAAKPIGAGETILVIEDEEDVQLMVARSLNNFGYKVLIADNGQDGLAQLGQHDDVDLLLTDVLLPGGMNGQEIADLAQESHPKLKVLFMSGYSRDAIIDQGRLRPDVRLIAKPFVPIELGRRVRDVLNES
jgi:PAS domain S-box-containing protein